MAWICRRTGRGGLRIGTGSYSPGDFDDGLWSPVSRWQQISPKNKQAFLLKKQYFQHTIEKVNHLAGSKCRLEFGQS
jgi:hypothetical protein